MSESTPATGPVTVACPICRESFPVPTTVLHVDETNDRVLVSLDRRELYGHLAACAAGEPEDDTEPEPDQVERELAMGRHPAGQLPPFIARGSRPCTMCGTHSDVCLSNLDAQPGTSPCCGACGEGNTHPARHDTVPCAQWPAYAGASH